MVKWTAKTFTKDGNGSYSVQVMRQDTDEAREDSFWIDAWVADDEIHFDWNQYIFYLTNPDDVWRKNIQEDCNEFDEATGVAIDYLVDAGELYEDDCLEWHFKN